MKIKKLFNIALCFVLITTSIPFCVSAETLDVIENEPHVAEYVPGEIIITTSDELIDTSSVFTTLSADENYTLINFEETEIESAKELNTYNKTSDERTYVIEIDGDVSEKCKELEKLPGVVCAEPNIVFNTMEFTMPGEITSGSLYQTHMKWYFDLMNIPDAWQEFESTGEGVVVAVIDNGYKIDATDFPKNLWTDENGNHGWNTYTDSADISPIYKKDGTAFDNTDHGTHVAGIIGAQANGSNLIGAAYSTELMLINAAHYNDETVAPNFNLDDLVEAIDYARINGADVINMSVGAHAVANSLELAVNRAYDAGIAVIAAAGNEATSTEVSKTIPASYENVIGVMASDKTNTTQLAYFSNYDPSGLYYDVAVPGYQLLSCSIESGKVAYGSGTSQASPLVAACAALYLSEYPDASVSELYEAIRNSPTTYVKSNSELVTDTTYKFKRLDALQLLEYGKVDPEIVFNNNSNIVNDPTTGYVYGFEEGYADISDYITITEGTGYFEFVTTENGNGTGSVYNVYTIYGELYKSYKIIIFGDLDGDCYADGQDAVITSWIIDSPDLFTEEQKYAADVDGDYTVTEFDYSIIHGYAIKIDYVSQIK